MIQLDTHQTAYVVFTDVDASLKAEYNHWYDTEHVRSILQTPGFQAAYRFERDERLQTTLASHLGAEQLLMSHMAIYLIDFPQRLDSPEFEAARASKLPGGNPELTERMRTTMRRVVKRPYVGEAQVNHGETTSAWDPQERLILLATQDGEFASKLLSHLASPQSSFAGMHLKASEYQVSDVQTGTRKEPGPDHLIAVGFDQVTEEAIQSWASAVTAAGERGMLRGLSWLGAFRPLWASR